MLNKCDSFSCKSWNVKRNETQPLKTSCFNSIAVELYLTKMNSPHQQLYTTNNATKQRAQRQHRGERSGTLPCKWSLTWQLSSHFPVAFGTISAVTNVAGNRLRTSVRWPRSSSVFPWKKAEWMSTSLPMPNRCQATAWCWHNSIPGRLPNTYPLIAFTKR